MVDRGSDGEVADFRWLLSRVASEGQILAEFDQGDLEVFCELLGESRLGRLDRLVLGAVLSARHSATAFQYMS